MLYGAVLRSPHPHARIVSVDTVAAEAHPKVKAVITGETLSAQGLAWMPTLSGDVQAVLATDKVRFQGQEVAFVVAEDRYSARDALELIDVEYEPLPPVVDARRALEPGAPVIRDDLEGRPGQPHLRLGGRRRGPHRGGVRRRRGHGDPGHALPAGAPGPAGDLRRGRGLRRGERQADDLGHQRRPRTRTGSCTPWSPACPSTRSG
jgi:CO/xanthine dehydrogenase Mo-binding subunit